MSQETLNAHLHIRSGVENASNLSICSTCDDSSSDHCHCTVVSISEEIKRSCKQARDKCQFAQNEKVRSKEPISKERQEKLTASLSAENERIAKVKESLQSKSNFLSTALMKSVYGNSKRDIYEDGIEKCQKKTKSSH